MTPAFESKASVTLPRHKATGRVRRWLPWVGAVLLVAVLVIGFRPQPIAVETAHVGLGTLRATVNEEGRTRIKKRFVVSAPVTGTLRRIDYKAGTEVRGQKTVVAIIDPLPPAPLDARSRSLAEARRDAAVANLDKAREAHRFAAVELRRFQQLFEERTISAQELESVQWRETAATKERTAAESDLRQAEAQLSEFGLANNITNSPLLVPMEIPAPIDGKVLRVFEESTRVVSSGTPLVELGDPADLEVVIEVLSRDGAGIRTGTPVELDQWGGEESLPARVRLVEPAAFTKVSALGVEEQRVNVIADLEAPVEKRPGLGDNFRVEARILLWETESTLKVPAGALFRRGKEWACFVVDQGRTKLRRVEVGQSSGFETQILGGLAEGEEVVLYPGDRVREGLRIRSVKI